MKSLHIFRICATICVALFTQALLASTINLNSGTYKDLYLDADTVRINGNVTVTDTMYITSGTKVIFNGDHTLDVWALFTIGAPGDSIYFFPDENLPQSIAGKLIVEYNTYYPCPGGYDCTTSQIECCAFSNLSKVVLPQPVNCRISDCYRADILKPDSCYLDANDTIKLIYGISNSTVKYTSVFECEAVNPYNTPELFFLNGCLFESNDGTLEIYTDRLYIRHNIFRGNRATPVRINTLYFLQDITNNLFVENKATNGPGGIDLALSVAPPMYNMVIYNNTFYGNEGTLGNSLHVNVLFPLYLFNNIFWNSQPVPEREIMFEGNPVYTGAMFNCTVREGMSGMDIPAGYAFTFTDIYDQYPDFVDSLDGANLELRIGSPCIDVGTTDVMGLNPNIFFNKDLKGDPRVYVDLVDLGAYEYIPGDPALDYVTPDTIACLGDSLTLEALSGDMFRYDWYKDGQLLFSGFQERLYIVPFTVGDTGYYQAAVSNAADTIWSGPIHLDYDVPPVITDVTHLTEVCRGEPAELSLVVESTTPPVYEWYSTSSGLLPETGNTLTIDHAQESDLFTVFVHTQCFSTDDTLILEVFPLPEPDLGKDTALFAGDSLLLDPGIYDTYTWSTGSNDAAIYGYPDHQYWVEVSNEFACVGRDTVFIALEPLSLIGSKDQSGFLVYPNPSDGVMYIEIPADSDFPCTLSVYSQDGRLLRSAVYQNEGAQQIVTYAELPAGTYMLTIQSGTRINKEVLIIH